MKIVEKSDLQVINVTTMQPGQIGVIVGWNGDSRHVGQIVQRCYTFLFALGHCNDCWSSIPFGKNNDTDWNRSLVRILPEGTVLEI